MSKTKLQKTPWGFRPAHWKMLSWNYFATPSGEPITVAPDSRAKQVTVRVRHKGVVERRGKKNQPRVIRNLNQTQISAGQFIISRIDARNGACGIVPKELEGAIVTKDFRVFDIDSTILLTSYLDYLIGLPVFWKLCSFISDGTTNRVRLDMELFDQMRFPIPPLIEQEIAVNTLQSIDDTLKRTGYIIITAEKLREAILHKLLTRGLPGHHTEWKEVSGLGVIPATWQIMPFGDVADISFSNVDKKTREGEIPVRLCNYTDVFYNRSVHSGLSFSSATATSKEYQRWELKKDDVLFTKDSESPYEIGIPSFVNEDMPGVLCGYHLGLARPKSNLIQGQFLSLVIGSDMYRGSFARIANGVTRFGLTLNSTRAMKVLVPSLVEQNMISKLVDQINKVIDSLILEYDMLFLLQNSTLEDLISKGANCLTKGEKMGKVNTESMKRANNYGQERDNYDG